jgi:signal transduction histidine kinase
VESGELFELAEGHLTVFGVAAGLPKAPLRALYADADGSLWIGTIGGGLVLRRNGHFTRISAANGLPDDEVSEILEDDSGRLWCGSRAGIFHVAKSDLLAFADGRSSKVNGVTFGRSEGLSGISCLGTCQPAAWKARTGQLWFTTQQGALALDSSALKPNRRAPPVFIDELLVNDQPFDRLLRAAGVLRIPPICRKLEFRFAALSFAAPEKVHLRYRLDKIDSQWLELVGQRAAIYAGLPPGNYRMRVTACNNDGVWNETGATLAFEVLPAWWQSWRFKAAELFFFTATLALGVRYWSRRRLKLKLERLEHQQAMGRERTRIARDLHDDLGASLTQVGLMVEELKEAPRLTDELKDKSAALSSRVRTLARDLDAVVWTVNPKNDSLNELVAYLSQFFLECFRRTPIRPRLQVMDDIPEHALSPEVRHHLFLAMKEAIHNVIKHSQATEATLHLGMVAGAFEARLEDNGRGFSPAAAAQSQRQGLSNMRVRIQELAGQLEVVSAPGKGTSVRIRIILGDIQDRKPGHH